MRITISIEADDAAEATAILGKLNAKATKPAPAAEPEGDEPAPPKRRAAAVVEEPADDEPAPPKAKGKGKPAPEPEPEGDDEDAQRDAIREVLAEIAAASDRSTAIKAIAKFGASVNEIEVDELPAALKAAKAKLAAIG